MNTETHFEGYTLVFFFYVQFIIHSKDIFKYFFLLSFNLSFTKLNLENININSIDIKIFQIISDLFFLFLFVSERIILYNDQKY